MAIRNARMSPWQSFWISFAGPLTGGVGAAAVWLVGEQQDSQLLQALGYVGFLLNLFNLIPVGFLDGGSIWRAIKTMRLGGTPGKAACGVVLLRRARRAARDRHDRRPRPAAPALMTKTAASSSTSTATSPHTWR